MQTHLDIYVLSTNQDHDGTELDVIADNWLPYGENAKVQYLSKSNRKYGSIKSIMDEVQPDVVYLNGMYSVPFVIYPLIALKQLKHVKTVIAPRGMLQRQSLSIKPLKKKLYLNLLNLFLLNRNVHFHVTTTQEMDELQKFFFQRRHLHLVGNVPSFNPDMASFTETRVNRKVFGTVALISPMKNIHLILQALKLINDPVEYHIYGPVKDENYWHKCMDIISTIPEHIKVSHQGDIEPGKVDAVISSFDFYIQPSKSENFGHSIFEAFNQGIPVIISDQTPWKSLKEKQAGWDVDLREHSALRIAMEEALGMDDVTYVKYRNGARKIAEQYMQEHDFVQLYLDMFKV